MSSMGKKATYAAKAAAGAGSEEKREKVEKVEKREKRVEKVEKVEKEEEKHESAAPRPKPSGPLIPAAELKKLQAAKGGEEAGKDREAREDDFVERFRASADAYYQRIMDEAHLAIDGAKEGTRSYAILNSGALMARQDTFSYSTMLYGFWNNEKKAFNQAIFIKNAIQMPFERARIDLRKAGYKLENVSDPSKSLKLFLKISW